MNIKRYGNEFINADGDRTSPRSNWQAVINGRRNLSDYDGWERNIMLSPEFVEYRDIYTHNFSNFKRLWDEWVNTLTPTSTPAGEVGKEYLLTGGAEQEEGDFWDNIPEGTFVNRNGAEYGVPCRMTEFPDTVLVVGRYRFLVADIEDLSNNHVIRQIWRSTWEKQLPKFLTEGIETVDRREMKTSG